MGITRSWNHAVYRLGPAEIDRNDLFGITCVTGRFREARVVPLQGIKKDELAAAHGYFENKRLLPALQLAPVPRPVHCGRLM